MKNFILLAFSVLSFSVNAQLFKPENLNACGIEASVRRIVLHVQNNQTKRNETAEPTYLFFRFSEGFTNQYVSVDGGAFTNFPVGNVDRSDPGVSNSTLTYSNGRFEKLIMNAGIDTQLEFHLFNFLSLDAEVSCTPTALILKNKLTENYKMVKPGVFQTYAGLSFNIPTENADGYDNGHLSFKILFNLRDPSAATVGVKWTFVKDK